MSPSSARGLASKRAFEIPELTGLVLSSLKEVALTDGGILVEGDETLTLLSPPWKACFSRLALVNHVFFRASIHVLWENMTSLRPLFALLLPWDAIGHSRMYMTFTDGISESQWARFDTYASKLKALVLNIGPTPSVDLCWAAYITSCRPRPLFPALQRVLMFSTDAIAAAVLLPSLAHLRHFHLDFTREYEFKSRSTASAAARIATSVALVTGVTERSKHLEKLRIINPTSCSIIMNAVARVGTLTDLCLRTKTAITRAQLGSLKHLALLRSLEIEQECDGEIVEGGKENIPGAVRAAMVGSSESEPSLGSLRTLRVRGSTSAQAMVATSLRPGHLEKLSLEVTEAGINEQILYTPLVVTFYLTCNPELQSVVVSCDASDGVGATPVVVGPLASDAGSLKRLVTSLSSLGRLRTLELVRVPFLQRRAIVKILGALPSLPKLRRLRLHPHPGHAPKSPGLECLQRLAISNPHIRHLEITLDTSNVPAVPEGGPSTPRLRRLFLHSDGDADSKENSLTDHSIALSMYLDGVFPSLKKLADDLDETDHRQRWRYWKGIESLVLSHQGVRARALVTRD